MDAPHVPYPSLANDTILTAWLAPATVEGGIKES